ncbi:3422_t:CDS:2 [Rhizophagus irregularis]|nr:3422_t:CDS:2 [Rhizophagus irregularis]
MNFEDCTHNHTETFEGNKVCRDCGIVLNDIFEQQGEIVPDRSGKPETIDGGTQDPGTEKKNPLVEPILNQTLSTLDLLDLKTRVITYYNAVDKNFIIGEGKLLHYVIAACALLVLREEKIPRTLREIAYLLELDLSRLCEVLFMIRSKFAPNVTNFVSVEDLIIRSIGIMFEDEKHKINFPLYTDIKQICHLKEDIHVYEKRKEIDLPNNTNNMESEEYREKMIKIYRVVFTGICMELLKYANDAFILSGRQPSFLGAAISLLAIEATEKPSVQEVKKSRKNVIHTISKIFMVDCHFVLFERYRELLDVIYHKVINIIPWCTHAKENKSRSYLYVTDLVQFQEWILKRVILTSTDTSGFASSFTDNINERNEQNNNGDIEFDEAELDEYMRDEEEVEMFKKVWESLQSNTIEKSEKNKNTRLKKTTRLKRLREKDGEDKTSNHIEHLSSAGESSPICTDKNSRKNKRVKAGPKSDVKKLNVSIIDNINYDDFDHI